jgi:ABC-2 type transport system ATP-binding protein
VADLEAGSGPGAARTEPLLSLEGLTKHFAERRALDGLSLTVGPGEIYGLIGPNGSGKTTTVKLAAGRVRIAGIDLQREPERAKRLLGYVPDEPFAYERLSGREFLHLVGELWGVAAAARTRAMDELAEVFRVGAILDSDVDNYSRGNRQKLSLMAALLHAPRLLVIDEPIVGLDPESALRTRDLLLRYAAAGGGILLCTHTLSFAEAVCRRVGLLRDGRLVAEGDLAGLRARAGVRDGSLEGLYLHFAAGR